eukprot:1949666-Rhodomonas_salina.1
MSVLAHAVSIRAQRCAGIARAGHWIREFGAAQTTEVSAVCSGPIHPEIKHKKPHSCVIQGLRMSYRPVCHARESEQSQHAIFLKLRFSSAQKHKTQCN